MSSAEVNQGRREEGKPQGRNQGRSGEVKPQGRKQGRREEGNSRDHKQGRREGDKPQGHKKGRKEAITFNVQSRFEFLNGFSKRKAERKKKGNLINLKKEQQRKRDETNQYKHHVQKEYQKTIAAAKHNYGAEEVVATVEQIPVVEEHTVFYPNAGSDPFGDVSIQISSLESHQFATLNRALDNGDQPPKAPAVKTEQKTTTATKSKPFAKFKRLARSSKFLQKRKVRAKEDRAKDGRMKVKKTTKTGKGKKQGKSKSR